MNVDDVIGYFGTAEKAARQLGLSSHASVLWWRKNGIPIPRQYQIQAVTGGELRAPDVSSLETKGGAANA